jgi:tetratricopeptide (TPR) repeat protein
MIGDMSLAISTTASSAGPATAPPASGRAVAPAGESGASPLATTSVARRVLGLAEDRATGTLVITRGQMRKELFLRDGILIAAESNLREEALGSMLVARGIIDEARLERLLREVRASGRKMGAVLVELGWLSPEGVLAELAEQVRRRLVHCLRWIDAEAVFTPGEAPPRIVEHRVEADRLVFLGLSQTATPDALAALFDQIGDKAVRLRARFDRHKTAFEAAFGRDLPVLLGEGSVSVSELVFHPDAERITGALEGLLLTDLVTLDDWDEGSAAGESGVKTPRPEPGSAAEELAALPTGGRARPARVLSAGPGRGESGHEPAGAAAVRAWAGTSPAPGTSRSATQRLTAMPAKAKPQRAPADAVGEGPFDELDRRPRTNPGFAQTLQAGDDGAPRLIHPELRELHQVLLREYLELTGRTPYEVLGVMSSAPSAEITAAYQAKTTRFGPLLGPGALEDADRAKLDSVLNAYARALTVLSDPSSRKELEERRVPARPAGIDPLEAELAFSDGRKLLAAGEVKRARHQFQAAVDGRPDQAAYHAYLGWALHRLGGAEERKLGLERLRHAVDLDPAHAEAHGLLGRAALAEGDEATARQHLERAVGLEPDQSEVVEALLGLLAKAPDSDAAKAEKLVRRAIAALGERAPRLRRRLWDEALRLYEGALADPVNARLALEEQAKLDPNDEQVSTRLTKLAADDLRHFPDRMAALVTAWGRAPHDGSAAEALANLSVRAGRHDAAALVAAAAILRGSTSPSLARLAAEGRPRLVRRPAASLDGEHLRLLGRSETHARVEAFFGALAQDGIAPRFGLADLGLEPSAMLVPSALSPVIARSLAHVARALAVEPPARVGLHPALGADARLGDTRPATLLVGPGLLEVDDAILLTFRLGRALYLLSGGRLVGSTRREDELRSYVLAIRSGSVDAGDPDDVKGIKRRVAALHPDRQDVIADLAQALAADVADFASWQRALGAQATRAGLLLCADLLAAGGVVGAEEGSEALEQLISFALSAEHLELRERLGLATAL